MELDELSPEAWLERDAAIDQFLNYIVKEETFEAAVIRNMFPAPLTAYGSAFWAMGRQHNMYATGALTCGWR